MTTLDLQSGGGVLDLQSGGAFELQSSPPPLFSLVQSNFATVGNGSGTSITVSYSATPAQGNLLTCRVATNDGSFTGPSGWSLAIEEYNATDDDTIRIYWKVAGAGESVDVSLTGFPGNTKHVRIAEYYITSGYTVTLDKTVFNAESIGVTTKDGGTTGTLTNAIELVLGLVAVRANISATSVSSPFVIDADAANGFSTIMYSTLTSTNSTLTPSCNWTTAGNAWGATVSFKVDATGGGGTAKFSISGILG